jgi:predicted dehydrogenase
LAQTTCNGVAGASGPARGDNVSNTRTLKAVHIGLSVGHAGSFDDSKPRLIHDFRRLEGVEVVAYCELYDPSYLDDAKEHHPGAGLYSSVDDLIANEEFDLACVVLLPRDVPDALLKLANAGKHFMVDKQFAHKSEDLHEVVRAVRRNELTTFLAYPVRFHPAMQDLRGLIDEGVMGDPLFVEGRFVTGQVGGPHGSDPLGVPYRMETEGGGNLHYVGCHLLDGMRYLMGCEVKSVQAMNGRPLGYIEEPIEDLSILALEYENGGYGSLVCGYMSARGAPEWDRGLVFRGAEGQANWTPMLAPRLEVSSASEKWSGSPEKVIDYTLPPLPSIVFHVWFHNWIRRFVDDVRAGDRGVLTIDDALYVLQSIDAAYESARTGRRVEVKYGL